MPKHVNKGIIIDHTAGKPKEPVEYPAPEFRKEDMYNRVSAALTRNVDKLKGG